METRCSSADLGATPEVRYQVPRYSGWKQLSKSSSSISSGGSDTKYRVIADGNFQELKHLHPGILPSDTKYRVIADGNELYALRPLYSSKSDTKYRVIADGNKPAHG